MIKALRKGEKLSQPEAAGVFGISVSHYQKIENGGRTPSLKVAARIAEHFKRPISQLFFVFK